MANIENITGSKLYLKCLGALAGGVIGDAMGEPSEGKSPAEIESRFGWLDDFESGGTDDTIMRDVLAGTLIRTSGYATIDDWAADWLAAWDTIFGPKQNRFFLSVLHTARRLRIQGEPRLAALGNIPCSSSAMCIAPVGLVNACNPGAGGGAGNPPRFADQRPGRRLLPGRGGHRRRGRGGRVPLRCHRGVGSARGGRPHPRHQRRPHAGRRGAGPRRNPRPRLRRLPRLRARARRALLPTAQGQLAGDRAAHAGPVLAGSRRPGTVRDLPPPTSDATPTPWPPWPARSPAHSVERTQSGRTGWRRPSATPTRIRRNWLAGWPPRPSASWNASAPPAPR